ncbi:hypothetical protein RHOFW104T7_01810 [Rhodanobacter thiooxydans]|uniref:Uncharacterized protein n=1 Tax=Rhodanobacter thiooxydans TaxID=416169 RepID=A0A154QD91_9GAMM|nr:hypothetical protein [Rhodanobacter thiooxydans]EIM01318.1 hypothetical protein UUA_04573 [Rhodanobacter thiooxydans LCS2]KZC22200.1 hypothetical protein RHOFW104T7_01810 [Rhodanobacter thiooxydans]MCW0201911.1 hypothetical protein [Rhodanobacter thiooxydans]
MTITRLFGHFPLRHVLLAGACALAPLGAASAWQQSGTQPVIQPIPPSVRFQQDAQQQQVRDELQKSQQQQLLQQGVSDNAKRPMTDAARRRLDRADRAQRDRERARQQDLLDRERDASSLPRVVVPQSLPAAAHSGG